MDQKDKITEKLKEGGYSFVLYKEGEWSTSEKRGIAPIMELLKENRELLRGAYVADKVIGKAAALLLIEGGISYLHAEVISEHATECLQKANIEYEYQELVPYIVNRSGDGMCPMEETVLDVTDTKIAYELLQEKIKKMQAAMQAQNMK